MAQDKIVGVAIVKYTNSSGRLINVPIFAAGSGVLFAESKDIDFEKPNQEKYLDMLVFDIESKGDVPTLSINVGYRDNLKADVEWQGAEYIDLDNPIVKLRKTARFFKIRIEDENPTTTWKLSKIEAYGRVVGFGRL